MPILATRGCPYQCTFCSSPSMWTTRYIMRDPKEIVDEIEWLIKEYQANDFEFFILPYKRGSSTFSSAEARGSKLKF